MLECPKVLRVSAVRFDDGLTLDSSLPHPLLRVQACSDAIVFFSERLGDPNAAPAGGEFAFKKSAHSVT